MAATGARGGGTSTPCALQPSGFGATGSCSPSSLLKSGRRLFLKGDSFSGSVSIDTPCRLQLGGFEYHHFSEYCISVAVRLILAYILAVLVDILEL